MDVDKGTIDRAEILNALVQKSIGTSVVGISLDEPLNRLSLIPSPTNTTSTAKTLSEGLVLSSGVSFVVEPPQTVVAEYSGGQNLPGTGGCTLGFSIQRYGQESSITAEHCLDNAVLDGYAAPGITPSGLAIGIHSGGFIGGDSFGSKIGSALQSEGSFVKCLKISGGGCYY